MCERSNLFGVHKRQTCKISLAPPGTSEVPRAPLRTDIRDHQLQTARPGGSGGAGEGAARGVRGSLHVGRPGAPTPRSTPGRSASRARCARAGPAAGLSEGCESHCAATAWKSREYHTQVRRRPGWGRAGWAPGKEGPRRTRRPGGGGAGRWAAKTGSRELSAATAPPSRLGEPVDRPKMGPPTQGLGIPGGRCGAWRGLFF